MSQSYALLDVIETYLTFGVCATHRRLHTIYYTYYVTFFLLHGMNLDPRKAVPVEKKVLPPLIYFFQIKIATF
jgi:hypothetical protein